MKKVTERSMSNPQKIAQMQYYWNKLWHLTPDKDKKKNLEKRFGIKNLKVDNRGNIFISDKNHGIYVLRYDGLNP